MTNLQFILLLKTFFLDYFYNKGIKKPSMMNVYEIIELYKKQVIEEYKKKQNETQ